MSAAPAPRFFTYPISIGSRHEFTRLRELLQTCEFVQEKMDGLFRLRPLGEIEFEVQPQSSDIPGPFGVLANLFLGGKSVPVSQLRQEIGDQGPQLLSALGLIEPYQSDRCIATVAMYATRGLYIVSDRWCGVDGAPLQPLPDVVYPAVLGTTRGFLSMIPASPCESFLEVCAGTGIAALLAARNGAKHAYAFDIAGRSVHFAEFNRRLNGIENVTVEQGDLYTPAQGQKFERIVGHPPYVPVLEPKFIFYDGGQDGEQITRRMIQELPDYLETGGLFLCVSLGSDRVDQPFEQRVRSFLGEHADEFDIALFVRSEMEPAVQALNDVVRGRGSVEQVQRWREVLKKLKIVSFVFGGIYICRHGEARPGYTIRRTMGEKAGLQEIEAVMGWEKAVARGEDEAILMRSHLQTVPGCRLHASYSLKACTWQPEQQRFLIDEPFKMELDAPSWTTQVLAECDGTKTGQQLFESLKAQEILQPDTPSRAFADVLTVLVSGGFVMIEC